MVGESGLPDILPADEPRLGSKLCPPKVGLRLPGLAPGYGRTGCGISRPDMFGEEEDSRADRLLSLGGLGSSIEEAAKLIGVLGMGVFEPEIQTPST